MTLLPKTTISNVSGDLPIDLQAARQKVGEATADLDNELLIALEAATRFCEEATGRVLRKEGTVLEVYPHFPGRVVQFNYQPIISVESVQFYAPNEDTLTTIDPTEYRLIFSSNLGSVLQFDDGYQPASTDARGDAFQVTYKSGYDDQAVDSRAKQAILLKLPLYFDGMAGMDHANTDKMADALLRQIQWQLYQ